MLRGLTITHTGSLGVMPKVGGLALRRNCQALCQRLPRFVLSWTCAVMIITQLYNENCRSQRWGMGSLGMGPARHQAGFPTHHQILQGQQLVHVPQDLNFTLVGQLGGREAARLLLLLLNDLQALAGQSSPSSPGLRNLWPPRAQVLTFLPSKPAFPLPPHVCFCHSPHLKSPPSALPLYIPIIHPPT